MIWRTGDLEYKNLAIVAGKEDPDDPSTWVYHEGDCEYSSNVRDLEGVVRWIPDTYRGNEILSNYFLAYSHADLVYVGEQFSGKKSK